MASVARIRHTVLRLIGLPKALPARAVRSARDCRLRGWWVSATRSQASALIRAWSRGGELRFAAPSWLVFQGEGPGGPPVAPALHRPQMQLHPSCDFDVGHKRLVLQE